MLPSFVCLLVFLIPNILAIFLYGMDMHYLFDEVEMEAVILEPGYDPETVFDLSNFSMVQLFAFILVTPLLFLVQVWDFIRSSAVGIYNQCVVYRGIVAARLAKRRKKKGFISRLIKTARRLWSECWSVSLNSSSC